MATRPATAPEAAPTAVGLPSLSFSTIAQPRMAAAVAVMGALLLSGLWTAGLPAALVLTAVLSGLIWLALSRMRGVDRSATRILHRDINDNE